MVITFLFIVQLKSTQRVPITHTHTQLTWISPSCFVSACKQNFKKALEVVTSSQYYLWREKNVLIRARVCYLGSWSRDGRFHGGSVIVKLQLGLRCRLADIPAAWRNHRVLTMWRSQRWWDHSQTRRPGCMQKWSQTRQLINQSISDAELLRLCHCSVCGWVWWTHRTSSIKMGPEKFIRTTQNTLRGHATENIWLTTFHNHQNWLFKLLHVYSWPRRFGHIFRRPIINQVVSVLSCKSCCFFSHNYIC